MYWVKQATVVHLDLCSCLLCFETDAFSSFEFYAFFSPQIAFSALSKLPLFCQCLYLHLLLQLSKKSFPLCMQQLHSALRSNHHLRHGGRQQYGLFLKGIGLSLDEAIKFWRSEFSKIIDVDQVGWCVHRHKFSALIPVLIHKHVIWMYVISLLLFYGPAIWFDKRWILRTNFSTRFIHTCL